MSCSKYHYVKFLDEVEEISNSKTESENKFDFSEENTNMSSIDSELKNYLTYVSRIVKELEETRNENEKLKKENEKIKKENEDLNQKLKLNTFEADTRCDRDWET